jgi:molecular chaperone GrpE
MSESGAQNDATAAAPDASLEAQLAAALSTAKTAGEESQRAVRDAQLRAAAEIENIRKRAQRDVESAQRFALERFAAELLGVLDSLELGIANGAQADAASLLAGKQATLKLLQKAFEKFSIVQINPRDVAFDPTLHEAVLGQESATVPAGQVLEVLQSGYQLNGRLLRPARVIVSKAPEGVVPSPPDG